jgi:chemotaxis protein MotB
MFRKIDREEESNFWISYADLMAGLLFVFILLIGAIVSKSIILKTDLQSKEERLAKTEEDLLGKEGRLAALNQVLKEKLEYIEKQDENLSDKEKVLRDQRHTLALKEEEIKRLNRMLLEANTQRDALNGKITIVQNLLEASKVEQKRRTQELEEYKEKVLVLSNQLTDMNRSVALNETKMLQLLHALDEKETNYNKILENLQKQKARIKSLTGMKVKVIAALKQELGDKISIDPKSGSLRLSSNILFDKGSAQLKEQAKAALKQAFEEYVGALVTNPVIKPHLDKIVIEGHTDSDGGYLYNLDLSQKRAFAVMNYLLTLDIVDTYRLKPLIVASGRSYLDAIKVNGIEDKEASRRIEIKFRLKNEEAMREIERVLDEK